MESHFESSSTHHFTLLEYNRAFFSNGMKKILFIFLTGKPTPAIQWSRDNVPIISETYEAPGGRSVRSDITIGPLGRQDLNSRLSCKAINHPRATPVETTVQIDMNCEYYFVCCISQTFVTPHSTSARIHHILTTTV